jgi:pyridoxamine 5'-phosphate oxidase
MSDNDDTPELPGIDVSSLRRSASGLKLEREDLDSDPIRQFADWFRLACEGGGLDPNAVALSTVDEMALLFFWRELGRQVIIRGSAQKIPTRETLKYFATRPRGSQVGAWVSAQSSVISSRSLLEAKFDEMKRKFADKEVPLPSFWGGYRVVPEEIEFWQGRTNRLHDRFQYTRRDNGWTIERLAP